MFKMRNFVKQLYIIVLVVTLDNILVTSQEPKEATTTPFDIETTTGFATTSKHTPEPKEATTTPFDIETTTGFATTSKRTPAAEPEDITTTTPFSIETTTGFFTSTAAKTTTVTEKTTTVEETTTVTEKTTTVEDTTTVTEKTTTVEETTTVTEKTTSTEEDSCHCRLRGDPIVENCDYNLHFLGTGVFELSGSNDPGCQYVVRISNERHPSGVIVAKWMEITQGGNFIRIDRDHQVSVNGADPVDPPVSLSWVTVTKSGEDYVNAKLTSCDAAFQFWGKNDATRGLVIIPGDIIAQSTGLCNTDPEEK